ncbi:MAG: homoserine O-acetyltransferase [Crocinitomicaceae bacterium]|nr:homoserine O-acetyltransferase [Crocinitomicaceae bacterium]
MKSIYNYTSLFILESGQKLDGISITYSDYGPKEAARTIWVCHALSGTSEVLDWWGGLFGSNQLFDPAKDRIICANVLGSCYGTTGAQDFENPLSFPLITIKDMVKAHQLLADQLQLKKIDVLIGASLGGQQAVEWAVTNTDLINELILIATNAFHSPYARAFNEVQRLALQADQSFGEKNGGEKGLKAARAIAMMSYRSYDDFTLKQSEKENKAEDFKAASYVRYQGEKFLGRFNAYAYWYLSKAMDSHDILRGRSGTYESVLKIVKAKTLVIGIDSDSLFPVSEQKFLADKIPEATFGLIESPHGHDSFLIDYEKLNLLIDSFLRAKDRGIRAEGKLNDEKKNQTQTLLKRKINYLL